MVENNCIGIRRVDKNDLKKIAKASGATVVTTLANTDGEENFNSANLGQCEKVYE